MKTERPDRPNPLTTNLFYLFLMLSGTTLAQLYVRIELDNYSGIQGVRYNQALTNISNP